MPNHTANNFTVTGPKNDVLRFIAAVKTDETELDFNGVLPMPVELKGTTSPTRIVTQEEVDKKWSDWNKRKEAGTLDSHEKDRPWGLGLTMDQANELMSKYGATNWYDWCNTNWGTKWGAYDVSEWGINDVDADTSAATIYYETAWSPATALWLRVSKDYPTLEFYHEFADEGGAFLGSEVILDGQVISEEELDWDSDDGITLREGLGRYFPDIDEETESV